MLHTTYYDWTSSQKQLQFLNGQNQTLREVVDLELLLNANNQRDIERLIAEMIWERLSLFAFCDNSTDFTSLSIDF